MMEGASESVTERESEGEMMVFALHEVITLRDHRPLLSWSDRLAGYAIINGGSGDRARAARRGAARWTLDRLHDGRRKNH